MKIFAETERLILREVLLTDLDGFFELDSDPEVHQYLGNKPVNDKEEIKAYIKSIMQQYKNNGIGRWAIIDKKTKDFIGWAGLKLITEKTNNHINYYDLGYRIIKKYWGKGIATEAAKAALAYAFDKLNATEVFALADCKNMGSNNVLTKVGLRFVEEFDVDGVTHNWYKIEKKEFESNNLAGRPIHKNTI